MAVFVFIPDQANLPIPATKGVGGGASTVRFLRGKTGLSASPILMDTLHKRFGQRPQGPARAAFHIGG